MGRRILEFGEQYSKDRVIEELLGIGNTEHFQDRRYSSTSCVAVQFDYGPGPPLLFPPPLLVRYSIFQHTVGLFGRVISVRPVPTQHNTTQTGQGQTFML